jgi:hypothetical protein
MEDYRINYLEKKVIVLGTKHYYTTVPISDNGWKTMPYFSGKDNLTV